MIKGEFGFMEVFSEEIGAENLRELLLKYAALTEEAKTAASSKALIKTAVRVSANYLAKQIPGKTVEIRIPPYVAVQYLAGTTHRRGTPPNVVEFTPLQWLDLVVGKTKLVDLIKEDQVYVSGVRAGELVNYLPLVTINR